MNESERPSVEGLMQRIHYTVQQGDGAWRLSEPRLRTYAERLCADTAQPVASKELSDEQISAATIAADQAYMADAGKPRMMWSHYHARAIEAAIRASGQNK